MADSVDERLPEKKTSSSPHPSSSQPQQEQLRHRDPRDGRDLDRPPNLRDRSPSERSPSPHRDEKRCRRDDDSLRDSRFGELMSFKEFVQSLVDDTSPSEAVRKYEEYKSEYITEQKRLYFTTYKEEEWLKNMYHPTSLMNVIKRRYALAQEEAKTFLLALQKGTLDLGPAVNMSGRTSEPNSEDEAADGGERRRSDRGEAKETELVSSAPKAPSFTSDPKRIPTDIEQAQALVRKLDSEKGIEENVLSGSEDGKPVGSEKSHTGSTGPVTIERGLASVKGLEGVELLDTLVTYLWRVHGVDYYGKIEAKEAKGLRHVRAQGKGPEAKGDESENRFDSYWQERLKAPNPLKVIKHKIATEVSHPLVQKISDDKYGWIYGCGAKDCKKRFRAPEYVAKHLHQSHKDLLTQRMHKVVEEVYFQNYMRDLNAPTNFAETKKDNENVEAVPEPKKKTTNKQVIEWITKQWVRKSPPTNMDVGLTSSDEEYEGFLIQNSLFLSDAPYETTIQDVETFFSRNKVKGIITVKDETEYDDVTCSFLIEFETVAASLKGLEAAKGMTLLRRHITLARAVSGKYCTFRLRWYPCDHGHSTLKSVFEDVAKEWGKVYVYFPSETVNLAYLYMELRIGCKACDVIKAFGNDLSMPVIECTLKDKLTKKLSKNFWSDLSP